jgi:hypothetical protein
MTRLLAPMTAVGVVLAAGLVHGFWTHRWSVPPQVRQAAASLERIPLSLGDWEGQEFGQKGSEGEGLAGHRYVRYVNRRTQDTVTVAIVCGRGATIHTPDVCYGASGYNVIGKTRYTLHLPESDPDFFTAEMDKTSNTDQTRLRLFWSWYAAGRWEVSESPRLAFARHVVLYKLYVIREMTNPCEPDDDPCVEFMRQLLPELQRVLVAPGV